VPKLQTPRVTASDHAHYQEVRDLRERAVRALTRGEHLFHDPERHRLIVSELYLRLLDAPAPEALVKAEFYDCYRHLAEGGRLDALPLTVLPRIQVARAIGRILRGDHTPIAYEGEETTHDHDRDDRQEEALGGAHEGEAEVRRLQPRSL